MSFQLIIVSPQHLQSRLEFNLPRSSMCLNVLTCGGNLPCPSFHPQPHRQSKIPAASRNRISCHQGSSHSGIFRYSVTLRFKGRYETLTRPLYAEGPSIPVLDMSQLFFLGRGMYPDLYWHKLRVRMVPLDSYSLK